MRIQLHDVRYTYPAAKRPALAGVSFEVGAGITGVVGPNGAGKSTLLRLLAGVQQADAGVLLVDGAPPDVARTAGRIGLIPESPVFDGFLTVREFIDGISRMLRLPPAAPASLTDIWDLPLGSLSLGQKRKVELAAAGLGKPDLLLLDEPTNGLDPFALAQLRRALGELRDERTAIFVSSHHLDELQRTADRLLVMVAGRCAGCWTRAAAIDEFGTVEALFVSVAGATSPAGPPC